MARGAEAAGFVRKHWTTCRRPSTHLSRDVGVFAAACSHQDQWGA